ncbi:LytTR family transcriptional regulator [Shewanella electrodiphila]|uniref:LytTR family transcriptional regulator n=1 Tax=Shewanella electrodiphila TaxID=934143 RepID=A0ABT0KK22_9GAMM|nr:LytTR family DNA-binding domain-containing protein [Shewanella electrodiphila]MCL1044185.1 LytTR family transcriptional regulator [Shewanella electrodiphila]
MFWLNYSLNSRITLQKRALLTASITVLILCVFQPFGTYESELSFKYLRLAGYGVATFLAVFIAGMIEIALSHHRAKIKPYPLLIISLYITIAALCNHSYFVVAVYDSWHWENQLIFVFYVSTIAIFPVSIMYFRNHNNVTSTSKPTPSAPLSNARLTDTQSTDTQSTDAQLTNSRLTKAPLTEDKAQKTTDNSVVIQITGENKSDFLSVSLADIILIKSADNYCEIITIKDNQATVNLLRMTLVKALEQLPHDSDIVRCHRSYGVNLSHVKSFHGNANGLKLTMQFSDVIVPVSRSYIAVIKTALSLAPS